MKPPTWFTRLKRKYGSTASLLLGLFGLLFGALVYVKTAAREAVLDESFLSKLSGRVRPILIFSSKGTIDLDLGATEYIEPNITVRTVQETLGFELTLKGKRYLANAPLVTGVNVNVLPQSARRGQGYDWIVSLAPNSTFSSLADERPMDENAEWKFMVQILH